MKNPAVAEFVSTMYALTAQPLPTRTSVCVPALAWITRGMTRTVILETLLGGWSYGHLIECLLEVEDAEALSDL